MTKGAFKRSTTWCFLFVVGLVGNAAWGQAATASEAEEEDAYQLGSISFRSKGDIEFMPLAVLGGTLSGLAIFRYACSEANPDLSSKIEEAWRKSRLGQVQFNVNGREVPLADFKALKEKHGSFNLPAGKPECRHFGAYLAGFEESMPPSILKLLGLPLDQSPYDPGSKNPLLRIKIGHAGPTSGPIAHLGQENQNAAQMAVDELNAKKLMIRGKPVRFTLVWADDASNPALATEVANKLISAGVRAVVGHLNSGLSIPASQIYAKAGVPQVTPSLNRPGF